MVFMLMGTADGTDSSFKHPHEESEQRVKRWTRLALAMSRE